jgi:hypothetical protein
MKASRSSYDEMKCMPLSIWRGRWTVYGHVVHEKKGHACPSHTVSAVQCTASVTVT